MTRPLRLAFPERQVVIRGLPALAERAVRAVWGACVTEDEHAECSLLEVRRDDDGYAVTGENDIVDRTTEESHVAPMVEAFLYGALRRWHPEDTFLHAATVVLRGRPMVLSGSSGSGKSSIALEAARAGWDYVTDELTMIDGAVLRGISRTIQFHPIPAGTPLPARLQELDTESYRIKSEDGVVRHQPLYPWSRLRVIESPLRAEEALFVALEGPREETLLEPITPTQALAAAIRERRSERGSFGQLLGEGRAFRLSWREPAEAVVELARMCKRG